MSFWTTFKSLFTGPSSSSAKPTVYYDPLDDSVLQDPVTLVITTFDHEITMVVNRHNAVVYRRKGPKAFPNFRTHKTSSHHAYKIHRGRIDDYDDWHDDWDYYDNLTWGYLCAEILTDLWYDACYDPESDLYQDDWVESDIEDGSYDVAVDLLPGDAPEEYADQAGVTDDPVIVDPFESEQSDDHDLGEKVEADVYDDSDLGGDGDTSY